MYFTANAMTSAAAEFAKQRAAVLCKRARGALLGQPCRLIRRFHRHDFTDHAGMIRAAIFGAEKMVMSGLLRLDFEVLVSAGHDVMLETERRDKEAMDDVLRRHHQPYRAVNRNVECVDLGLSAGMLDLPHPLLGDDEDRQFPLGRLV